jgi:transcriptional regulator with XRE-family HTH domain
MLRKKNNLNQTELGEIVGLSYGAVGAIESGRNDPSTDTIIKLSNFFKVSADYLLQGIETDRTISESEQEILEVLRKDEAMTSAVMEFAKVKKKAVSYLGSYAAANQNAAIG